MERTSSDSQPCFLIPENNIRCIQAHLQTQLELFEQEFPETTVGETSYVCDIVRDKILGYEDDPYLSKTQNNCRRIYIASELFVNICSIYALTLNYEQQKIISEILQWEKYKKLFQKITSIKKQESKREKYFASEAQLKLLKSIQDRSDAEKRSSEDEKIKKGKEATQVQKERAEETAVNYERTKSQEKKLLEAPQEITHDHEINETLVSPLETSLRSEVSADFFGNITDIRREPIIDSFHIEHPSNVETQGLLLPSADLEISIGEPNIQQKTADDIYEILQILEDEIAPKEIAEVKQLDITLDTAEKSPKTTPQKLSDENQPVGDESHAVASESTSWSLPSLEVTEETKKKHRYLIIDKETVIHDYAAKALRSNRNINIQRVQVYEGPPKMLEAISANHLMTTPSRKSSLFGDVRSSKINKLYSRHLKVEKKPFTEETFLQRRTVEEQRKLDISKAVPNGDVEDVSVRAGMHSVAKSAVLAETPEKRLQDLELTGEAFPKESLVGVPMSRIITSAIESPEKERLERINDAPILSFPRAQQLQGISLEPKKASPPWFLCAKESPPRDKYRNFDYIFKKLQEYWSLFENQGMEKCITMREFFSLEGETSVANFLTVLRVVDKMSIQRKLLLEHKNRDVFIRPFERPFVSEGQLTLKGKQLML